MSTVRYVCAFLPHRKRREDELAHLIMRVKWNDSRAVVSLSLGYLIDPAHWEAKTQRCGLRSFHGPNRIPAAAINADIDRYREAARRVMSSYTVPPSADRVRDDLRVELGLDRPKVLTTADAWAQFHAAESIRCSWAPTTLKRLRNARRHVLSFAPFETLDGFTEANLAAFVNHLREDSGLCDVTVHRLLGYLRWFLKWCWERHMLTADDFTRFRPKLHRSSRPVIFLTWDELMTVWNYDAGPGGEHRNDCRDIFLFSCFTGLRYSDTQQLTWDDVDGRVLRLTTVKTAEPLTIELNDWSDAILARHIDRDHGSHCLPQIPNQVVNRNLKEIMRECGIDAPVKMTVYHGAQRTDRVVKKWEVIGSHAGRRTFICNALMMGIPPSIVMQWTGHSCYESMKPYIAIADGAKAEAMALFNGKR